MDSTIRARLALLLALCLPVWLPGCTALPTYGVPLPPLPASATAAEDAFTMPDGAVLPVRRWRPDGPPRAVVLALHGFNDSRDAWELPGPAFAAAGVALYAPDQRGFGAAPGRGRWAGTAVMQDDVLAAIRILHARHPGVPLFVMGESMGGALALTVAAEARAEGKAEGVAGWILLAPAVWGRAQQGIILSSGLWLVSTATPGLQVTGGEVPIRIRATDNRNALIRLARNPLTIRRTRFDALRGLTDLMDQAQADSGRLPPDTLVLYGAHDMLVPPDAVGRAWRAMPPSVRRAFYPNGYHLLMRDLNRDRVIGDVLSWITDRSAWLPSGADTAAAAWQAGSH